LPESSQPSHTPKQPETHSDYLGTGTGMNRSTKAAFTGLNQKFVDILGWVITVAWALSMGLHATNIGYEPPASIHVLMMVVAGAAFGTNFIKPKNGATNGK
jgi:hypothetical protein